MRNILIVLGVLLLILIGISFHYKTHFIKVKAEFKELEPFPKNLSVYYKGFKLGHSTKVYPSKDFTKTYVDLVLNINELALPDNSAIKIKTKNKNDYIELLYPKEPSVNYLKNGSIIKGEVSYNLSSYLSAQAENGGFDDLQDNLNTTISAAGDTFSALTDLINTSNSILTDIKPDIKKSTSNLVVASENLADLTQKLNNSAKAEYVNDTFKNIKDTSQNIEEITANTASITKKIDNKTVNLLDCLIKNINNVVLNINEIVCGIKSTLSKKFGGVRLFLGQSVQK